MAGHGDGGEEMGLGVRVVDRGYYHGMEKRNTNCFLCSDKKI